MKWLSRITAVATEVEEVTKEVYRRTFEDMAKRYIELNKKMEESEALIEQAIEEINARLEIAKLTEVTEKEENILKAMLYKLEEHKKSIDGWELKLAQAKKKSLKSKDFIEEITETFTEINPAYKQMIEFIASKHTEYPELDDIDTYKITLKKEKKAGLKINAAFVEKFKAALGKFINWLKDKWDSIIGKIDKKYADIEDAMKELENAPMLVVKEASIEREAKSITIEEYKAGIVDAVERAFPGKTFSIGVSSILTDQNFHTPLEALVEDGICAKPTSKYDFMAIIDADKKEADDLMTVIADHDNKIGYIGMGGDKVVLEETASLNKKARDWKYKLYIPINDDKYENPTDEGALELAKIAVAEITRILPTVPAEKEDLKDQLESVKMEFEDVVTIEDFDAALETLYDMGDSESIWIETYTKKASLNKEAEEKTFEIPTGNAQLVYSIDGIVGEEFEVDRGGTMLPIGKYKVVTKPKVDVEHSGPWGTYSTILVERIAGNRVTLKRKALLKKMAVKLTQLQINKLPSAAKSKLRNGEIPMLTKSGGTLEEFGGENAALVYRIWIHPHTVNENGEDYAMETNTLQEAIDEYDRFKNRGAENVIAAVVWDDDKNDFREVVAKTIRKKSSLKKEARDFTGRAKADFDYVEVDKNDSTAKIHLSIVGLTEKQEEAAESSITNFKEVGDKISKLVGFKVKWDDDSYGDDLIYSGTIKSDKSEDQIEKEIEKVLKGFEAYIKMSFKEASLKKEADKEFKVGDKVVDQEDLSLGVGKITTKYTNNTYEVEFKERHLVETGVPASVLKKASLKKEATSYTDFLTSYGAEIKEAIKQLKEINKIYDSLSEEILDKAHDKVVGIYDKNVPDYIEDWVADGDADVDSIASLALSNQDNYGTEKQMILYAIEDFYNVIMRGRKESSLKKKADETDEREVGDIVKIIKDPHGTEGLSGAEGVITKIQRETFDTTRGDITKKVYYVKLDNGEEIGVFNSDIEKIASLKKKADNYNPYMYTSPTGPATSDTKTNHKKYMVKFKEADGSWKFSTMEDDLEAAKSQAQEIYNNEKKKSKVIDTTTSNVIFVIGAENSEALKRYASLDADIDAMEKNEHKKHVEGFKKAASLQANIEKEVYQCDNCHIRLGRFIKQLPDSCPRCGKQVKFDNVIR